MQSRYAIRQNVLVGVVRADPLIPYLRGIEVYLGQGRRTEIEGQRSSQQVQRVAVIVCRIALQGLKGQTVDLVLRQPPLGLT